MAQRNRVIEEDFSEEIDLDREPIPLVFDPLGPAPSCRLFKLLGGPRSFASPFKLADPTHVVGSLRAIFPSLNVDPGQTAPRPGPGPLCYQEVLQRAGYYREIS